MFNLGLDVYFKEISPRSELNIVMQLVSSAHPGLKFQHKEIHSPIIHNAVTCNTVIYIIIVSPLMSICIYSYVYIYSHTTTGLVRTLLSKKYSTYNEYFLNFSIFHLTKQHMISELFKIFQTLYISDFIQLL